MKRASAVVVVLLCSVLGAPPMARASGSYGAVVEKGMRGCVIDHEPRIVMCFEAPGVNAETRAVFLQVWPAASPYFDRGDSTTATLKVRSAAVETGAPEPGAPQAGRPVITYVARVDLVLSLVACSDDLRFHASDGDIRLQRVVSDCKPR